MADGDSSRGVRVAPETVAPVETAEGSSMTAGPSVVAVRSLFRRLNPPDQLEDLMTLLAMPAQHRPSAVLSLAERQAKIIDWAWRQAEGPAKLEAALQTLLEEQSRPW